MKTWLCALCLAFAALSATSAATEQEKPTIKMGFYLPSLRDANLADVKISLQSWADELGKPYGYHVLTTTFEDAASMRSAFNRGDLDFVNGSGMELAEIFSANELREGYARRNQGVDEGLALVALKTAGVRSFSDLRGKRVSRLSKDRLIEVFLETLCLKTAARECRDFLSLTEEKRDIQSVYSVFFGKSDAALVSLPTLRTAIELNPQIGQRLTVVLDWKSQATTYGMMTRAANPELRNLVIKSARDATNTPRGRQFLEMFRTDHIEAVDSTTLNPFWALLQEYTELRKQVGTRKK